jgi:hypothetical protein
MNIPVSRSAAPASKGTAVIIELIHFIITFNLQAATFNIIPMFNNR